jgi:RES domain
VPPETSAEPKPPRPPADLATRPLPIEEKLAGTLWWRIHLRYYHPLFFGPSPGKLPQNRFDAPDGSYRICYLGLSEAASFAESFLREPGLILAEGDLEPRAFSRILNTDPLRLVELYGAGLAKIGATAAVASGPYDISQEWGLAFHGHPDQPDGILYRARHDDDVFCAAIFDRASAILTLSAIEPILKDRLRLQRLLARYGAILIS